MPQIIQFNLPQGDTLQPNDMAASTAREAGMVENRFGIESGHALGGAIESVGRQAGQAIDQHIAMQAISHGAANYSSLFSQLTQNWNQTASQSDPNDTSIQQGFKEKVLEPSLDKFVSSFDNAPTQAQEWALTRADQMRQHFAEKTSADMGIRAADAAHQNITSSVSNYSSIVTSDPTALPHALDSFRSDLKAQLASNPFLDASEKARINDELVPRATWEITKNALWAMGKTNPEQMKQDIVTGKVDIPGEYKNEALQLADTAQRDFDRQKLVNDESQKREIEARQTKNFGDGVGLALANTPLSQQKISEMVRNGDLSGQQAENLADFPVRLAQMHQDKTENTPHPQEFMKVMDALRFNQVENNVNMNDHVIWDAWNSGKINVHEFDQAMAFYKNATKPGETAFNKMLSSTESALAGNIQIGALKQTDADQYAADLNSMRADAYAKIEQARNSGQDISKLLDPKSSEYIFKNASSYFTPPSQVLKNGADKLRGTNPPQPGAIQGGYRFKGGDPAKPENWDKVQ